MMSKSIEKLLYNYKKAIEGGYDESVDCRDKILQRFREPEAEPAEVKGECGWLRQFDGHFAIDCANETGERANGNFHSDGKLKDAKWNFKYCPYCGRKIKIEAEILKGGKE